MLVVCLVFHDHVLNIASTLWTGVLDRYGCGGDAGQEADVLFGRFHERNCTSGRRIGCSWTRPGHPASAPPFTWLGTGK